MRSAEQRKQRVSREARTQALKIRMSDGEMRAFDERVAALNLPGLSRSTAARAFLLGAAMPAAPDRAPEPEGIAAARKELRAIRTLANQLAKASNAAMKSNNVNAAVSAMMADSQLKGIGDRLDRAAAALERIAGEGG